MIPIPSTSRMAATLLLVTILAGCAEHTPPPSHGFGGRHGHGGPAHGGPGPGRFFISPMGEPFHGGEGRTAVAIWFDGADADHDGRLTKAEFAADAKRFFAMLDADHDGEIDPAEITRYETEIVPQVASGGGPGRAGAGAPGGGRHGGGGQGRGGGGHRGGGMGHGGGMGGGETSEGGGGAAGAPEAPYTPQGAARYGFLGDPEPVVSADIDFDRSITLAEFVETAARRFALLDIAHQGYLTVATLPPLPGGRAGR